MARKNKGFTLLELIIAITVISVGMLGIFGMIANSMQASQDSKTRLVAAYLAQEGIELVRNSRDSNWNQGNEWTHGWPNCSSGCRTSYDNPTIRTYTPVPNGSNISVNTDGFYGESGTATQFQRTIYIAGSGDYQEVRSVVSWPGDNQVQVIKRLYNWR